MKGELLALEPVREDKKCIYLNTDEYVNPAPTKQTPDIAFMRLAYESYASYWHKRSAL